MRWRAAESTNGGANRLSRGEGHLSRVEGVAVADGFRHRAGASVSTWTAIPLPTRRTELPGEIMPAPTGKPSVHAGWGAKPWSHRASRPGRARSSRIAPRAWSPSTGPRIPPQSLGFSPKSEADRLSVALEAHSPVSRVSLDQGPVPSICSWPLTAGAGVSDWLNGWPLSTLRVCGDRRRTETVAPRG